MSDDDLKTLEKRHLLAIDKLKAKLFSRYSEKDFRIILDSAQKIPPSQAHPLKPHNLGGITYSLYEPMGASVSISHVEGKLFYIVVTALDNQGNPFTRMVTEKHFDVIDSFLLEALQAIRKESRV